jgi:hypothetical protein
MDQWVKTSSNFQRSISGSPVWRIDRRGSTLAVRYLLIDPLREGLESGDVPAGSQHLRDEQEADGGGEHVGGDAREVISVVLQVVEFAGVKLACPPIDGEGDGDHRESRLREGVFTVA